MDASKSYPLHGGQLRHIAERFSIPLSELLDFSANINPFGPPPAVLSTLRAGLDDLCTLTAYPDLLQTDLKRSIARYTGTGEKNVLVANGFVPLLEATLRTLDISRCLLPVPAFVEYRKTLERTGIQILSHPLDNSRSFRYDASALLAGDHEAILLANPQNPSGVCHDAAWMCDLVGRASKKSVYVLLDEAFIDYVPAHSLAQMTGQFPNLIVFRSLTKFFGFPGLRIAYAIANASVAKRVFENLPPWPITTMASQAAIAALGDEAYALRSRSCNRVEATALKAALNDRGLATYPAAANFILFRLPSSIDPYLFWSKLIVEHQIVLRSCANYEALGRAYFRVAVRTYDANRRLVDAVGRVLLELQR